MKEEDGEKIDISVFNEDIAVEHQMKMLIGFGALFGFRGSEEHVNLKIDQISNGTFSKKHPSFPGIEWWGIRHMPRDKCHHLGLRKSHVREVEAEFGRFPVIPHDSSRDFGGCIKRFMEKLPKSDLTSWVYRRVKKNGKGFETNAVIGKTKIRELFKNSFEKFGISNWQKLRPHALRAHFTTILANDGSVNATETMASCRHGSTSASATYQNAGMQSKSNRIDALLGRKRDSASVTENEDKKSRNEKLPFVTPNEKKQKTEVKCDNTNFSSS